TTKVSRQPFSEGCTALSSRLRAGAGAFYCADAGAAARQIAEVRPRIVLAACVMALPAELLRQGDLERTTLGVVVHQELLVLLVEDVIDAEMRFPARQLAFLRRPGQVRVVDVEGLGIAG